MLALERLVAISYNRLLRCLELKSGAAGASPSEFPTVYFASLLMVNSFHTWMLPS